MRRYSIRERILSGVAGAMLLFIAVAGVFLVSTDPSMLTIAALSTIVVIGSGGVVFAKIALTDTSATFPDRAVGPRRLSEQRSTQSSALGSIALDVLHAVGANVIAFVVGYPFAIFGPTFLVVVLPFGMFWAYVLLVGLYALSQFRKGRRRRAILAGSFVAIVLIALMTILPPH